MSESSTISRSLSALDRFIAYFADQLDFFHEGWGDEIYLEQALKAKPPLSFRPQSINLSWTKEWQNKHAIYRQAHFETSYENWILPNEVKKAYVELVLPLKSEMPPPVCVHFAATGDQGFVRRRNLMAKHLAKLGIGSLILENPFYGQRRPTHQKGFSLKRFLDLWLMVSATVHEGHALLQWLEKSGHEKIGVSGISMGGYVAALVASTYPSSLATVPCIAPHSGIPVFTQGVLSKACNWKALTADLPIHETAQQRMCKWLATTDIRNFPAPQNGKASIIVAGSYDAYIPSYSPKILHTHWPDSELRWIPAGHVGSFFFYRQHFIAAIEDAFARL